MKEYTLTFEERPGYLYAMVHGEHDSYDISKAFWQEIAIEADRLGLKRILIEEDIQETASQEDVFELLSAITEMGYKDKIIAFVDKYADQYNLNKFGEIIGIQFGLYGKLFRTIDLAETWLLEQENAEPLTKV